MHPPGRGGFTSRVTRFLEARLLAVKEAGRDAALSE
jgi:hypothetical protein